MYGAGAAGLDAIGLTKRNDDRYPAIENDAKKALRRLANSVSVIDLPARRDAISQ